MFKRLNKRRRELLIQLIKRTRFNKDLALYIYNRFLWALHNKRKNPKVPHPTNCMIELGNRCNLHCHICPREYVYGKAMDQGFMPLDKTLSLISEMIPYLDSIGLTGLGETVLYPNLLEVLQYVKSRKPSVVTTISTNAHFKGYLERIEPLLPYLDSIQFSVDGIGKVYEEMRPGTDFSFIKENIRQTIHKSISAKSSTGNGTSFIMNFVVSHHNYMDMANIIKLADELGIKFVNFNRMSIVAMPQRNVSYYDFLDREDFKEAQDTALKEAAKHPEMEITGLPMTIKCPHQFQDCYSVWQYPYITWDGYYVACCNKPFPKELNFGNVFIDGLMQTINSAKAQRFRRLWIKNTPPKFCHNCVHTIGKV